MSIGHPESTEKERGERNNLEHDVKHLHGAVGAVWRGRLGEERMPVVASRMTRPADKRMPKASNTGGRRSGHISAEWRFC